MSSAVGFIGFGEAGFHLARGLLGSGAREVFAYDLHRRTPGPGERIEERARMSGASLVDSPGELASRCNLLLSVVVAASALDAARQTAPSLSSRHLYLDLNSVSPGTKEDVCSAVAAAGAAFVEGVMMAPVPRYAHRVPILLGGESASRLTERLAPFGMRMEIVSKRIGSAAAVKMCRSVVVKGLEALILESVLAASRYEACDRVFGSLEETFPGLGWEKLAGYMMSRVVIHGERRAQEMAEVSRTLTDSGVVPIMTEAAARRQKDCADLDLARFFPDGVPEDYRPIIEAVRKALSHRDLRGPF